MPKILPIFILVSIIHLTITASESSSINRELNPTKVHYEWKYANFTWPSVEVYERALKNNDYIMENNPLVGIKLWKNVMYLTIPRWKDGVPATLVSVPVQHVNGNKSPLLTPYPNWKYQRIGDCTALQFVQSMEIDPLGRMWIIDTGRVATLTADPKNYCPARLIVIDLERDGEILLDYTFPEHVANRSTVYLNDIVLDHVSGGWAFISDTDDHVPGIIVFSLGLRKSWKMTHPTMKATTANFTVKHDGTRVTKSLNIDGIALSPFYQQNDRQLYYSPLSSLDTYSVLLRALKSGRRNATSVIPDYFVETIGKKSSQSDGMIGTANSWLYFGLLADNAVARWNQLEMPRFDYKNLYNDDEKLQWPDGFAIDDEGDGLWTVSNRLQRFLADEIDPNVINFRVIKLVEKLGVKNYMYHENGDAPDFPIIQ